jgi:hypothetical protein
MGYKLEKLVKKIQLFLFFFAVSLTADIDFRKNKIVSSEKLSLFNEARIYKLTATHNNMILKSEKVSQPNKKQLKKFNTLSRKDKYAIQVFNQDGKQIILLGIGNPFYAHAQHTGYENSDVFGGYIEADIDIVVPLGANVSYISLLSQNEYGLKEIKRIKVD